MGVKKIISEDTKKLIELETKFTCAEKSKLISNDKSIIQRYLLSVGEKCLFIKKSRNNTYLLCGQNIDGAKETDYDSLKEYFDIYEKSKDLEYIRERFIFLAIKNLTMLNWGQHIEDTERAYKVKEREEKRHKEIESWEMPLY